jgi:4-amino-4-deoxy-L-arabinose transferase-like glycosyltransferase
LVGLGWNNGIRLVELGRAALLVFESLGSLALLVLSAFGFGTLVLRIVGLMNRTEPEFYLFSISLGLGAEAHLMLGVAALGLLYRAVACTLLAAGLLIGLFDVTRHYDVYRDALTRIRLFGGSRWFSVSLIVLLLLSWLYPLLSTALVPPYNWDEVAYHLAIPKIYIQEHTLTYIPFIPYSNWPLEAEMLFTLSLLMEREFLTHLISWTTLLLTCWGLFLLGRRLLQRRVGLLAAVVFSSTPMVGTLAGSALIEAPLTLYTLLAVIGFLIWLETGDRRFWILSALTGGLAASTKLNGALVPLILGLFMVLADVVQNRTKPGIVVKRFVLFGLLAFVVVAPWYAKSWVQTGNPFWPFFRDALGGRNWDALGNEYLLGFIRLPNMRATFRNWLYGLGRLTFDPGQFGPGRVRLGWYYGLTLPLVLPALMFARSRNREIVIWLAGLGVAFYTAWFFQTHQTRFLMPTIPVLALLVASGLAWLWSTRNRLWPTLVQSLVVVSLTATSWIASSSDRSHIASRWLFISGQLTRDEFLAREIPGYETYAYANEHLPEDARVLLALWESRGYYLERDYMWANPISQRFIRFERFSSAEQLADELRARGFTHIIFRSTRLDRYTYIRHGETITDLFMTLLAEEAELVYTSSELSLYELCPESPS